MFEQSADSSHWVGWGPRNVPIDPLIPADAGNSGKLGRDLPHQIPTYAGMSEFFESTPPPHCQRKLAPMAAG